MWPFAVALAFCTFNGHMCASDVDRQEKMTTCELIMDLGYSCETSQITTKDGFVIEVDRVGSGRTSDAAISKNASRRSPVLIVPGILCDSCAFFLSYPPQSAGFVVADRGYDVWSMNTREELRRTYNEHISQDEDRYWRWSFHEIGRHDVAAAIDHVLNATGSTKLCLFAFSQGFLATSILLSTRPEYNDKIDILIGYGPVTQVSHIRFPFPELIAFAEPLRVILDPDGNGAPVYLPESARRILQGLCKTLDGEPCSLFLILTVLSSEHQLNKTRIPVALNHFPVATSVQNLLHYVQLYRGKRFGAFDYGPYKNKQLYGQEKPPSYPVERIRVPMALFSAEGDILANPDDLSAFIGRLSSPPLFNRVVPQRDFRHLDFFLGPKTYSYLHKPMIDTLEEYAGTKE